MDIIKMNALKVLTLAAGPANKHACYIHDNQC